MKTKIAIFCSGSGSNAEKIFEYFQSHEHIEIGLLMVNNATAYALERAKKYNIPSVIFSKEEYKEGKIIKILENHQISWIVLAGFLWLIPEYLVDMFHNRMINIHPALLPSYGGKGMYGKHVHEAVVANQESFSGITIHLVNKNYDEGEILFQAKCELEKSDTPETVAAKVLKLEHSHFARVIEQTVLSSTSNKLF